MTILIFFIILGTLVFVHELGHFVVARRNGVIAEEFGFGFPPRLVGTYKDKTGRRRWVFGNKEIQEEVKHREETIFSFNIIPLGGFVKIKGEDGEDRSDPHSFGAQSLWTRFRILSAGVTMNFLLGVVLLSFAFWLGLPEAVDDDVVAPDVKVQVAQVAKDSPAESAGLQIGDEVLAVDGQAITRIDQLQGLIKESAGQPMAIEIQRIHAASTMTVEVTPRSEAPEGQGLLGVTLAKTRFVSYPFHQAFWLAIKASFSLLWEIISFIIQFFVNLFTQQKVVAEVVGPVGIAVLTGQAARLGLAYLLQFASVLSINLAVINFLPIPALDGGRVVFLLIEKFKGSPVNQKVEGYFHTIVFVLLICLMILITVKDFNTFDLFDRVKQLFL